MQSRLRRRVERRNHAEPDGDAGAGRDGVSDEPDETAPISFKDKLSLKLMKAQTTTTKDVLLSGLRGGLLDLAKGDIKRGKLDPSKPYELKPNAERLITAWRKNFITGNALKHTNTTDEELKTMMKEVLIEVGFKDIRE